MTTSLNNSTSLTPGRAENQSGIARGLAGLASRVWLPGSVFVVFVAAWWFAVWIFSIPQYLIPSPADVWKSGSESFSLLLSASVTTGKEVVFGFLLAVLIGVPMGTLLGESPVVQRALYPLMVIAQIIPKVSLAPLMIVWFGLGLSSKLVFIVLISFFPIIVNTMVGISSASSELDTLARAIGLPRLSTFLKVTLPQALPSVFAGLKIAITLSMIGAVVAEFISAQSGLGFAILVAQGQLLTARLFAAIIFLTVLGLIFYGLVALFENLAIPWKGES